MILFDKNKLVNAPLVSVVLCAYNRETIIRQTIDSILSQKCNFLFELIIGEDFSTDRTREICIDYQKRYPDILKLVLQDENCGAGRNWAITIKEARGNYIAVSDDDDYWHNPDKLRIQVDYLEKHQDCDMVHTEIDLLQVRKNKIIHNYNLVQNRNPHNNTFKDIFFSKAHICYSSSMFRAELVRKYIPLDDYIRLRFPVQDWPTWVFLSKYCKIDYLPVSTTTYRTGSESVSNPLQYDKLEKRLALDRIMIDYLCDKFPDDLVPSESFFEKYANSRLLNLAYKKSDFQSARKFAKCHT